MWEKFNHALRNGWVLTCVMVALFCAAIALAFWEVLPANVIFLAPDAPLEFPTFGEAVTRLCDPAPAVLNLFRLFPFGFAYEGSFWGDMLLCCLAAVFLLRSNRLTWGAAWVGGFAAAFTGYFATLFCAGHRGVVDAIAVTCFAFGLVNRAMTRGEWRWWIALGALLPLGLAAQADIWLILLVGVFAYSLFLLVKRCRAEGVKPTAKRLLPGVLCAAVCFGIVGIPALRHTFGAAQETRSAQLTQATASATSSATERMARWQFTTDWSLPPEDLLECAVPGARGHTSYPFDPSPYRGRMGSAYQVLRQHSVHLGWVTLLLVVAAFCLKLSYESRSERLFWAGLAVGGVLLALGKYMPLYEFVWELPFINQVRAPVKWLHLTGFACAILAGYGAEGIIKRWGQGAAVLLCVAIAGVGVCVIRPFVFPIRLPTETEMRRLPPQTRLFAAPTYHSFIRAHGFVPAQTPYHAQAALVLQPAQRGFELTLIQPETSR